MKYVVSLFALIWIVSYSPSPKGIAIEWTDKLEGDFSFAQEWSYPENVFRNEFGQLVCDGFCTNEIIRMHNGKGRIPNDSLEKYYQLLDTTHVYHTISCDANCYEFAGTDYIEAEKVGKDTVRCYTLCNAGTHSSLAFDIVNNNCTPVIELNSITPQGEVTFPSTGGYIKIDRKEWERGILKAQFHFTFQHDDSAMWWEGRIYTTIKGQ